MELLDVYPFNLAMQIFGKEEKALGIYVPGIEDALNTLTDREKDILIMRYKNKLTLQLIGDRYDIGRERVRQITVRAVWKMRHPSRARMFKAVPVRELEQKQVEYNKLAQEHDTLMNLFDTFIKKPSNLPTYAKTSVEVMQTPIIDLDLSVRSYNALMRAGKRTLRDVVEMRETELRRVRNLGSKSAREILVKVHDLGLEMKSEEE